MNSYVKDPDAVLDYAFDWSSWLTTGETIDSDTVIVSTGITHDSTTEADTAITVWLSGGTAGVDYFVTCRITTNQGRTDDRTSRIQVRER